MSRNILMALLLALCLILAVGASGCTSSTTVNNPPPATVVVNNPPNVVVNNPPATVVVNNPPATVVVVSK